MTADIKTDIANEALRIVTGARRAAYGRPEQNFERIALLWQAWFDAKGWVILPRSRAYSKYEIVEADRGDGAYKKADIERQIRKDEVKLGAGDVAAFMRLMKEARLAETPDHRDSYVDLVGYALCGAEVAGVQVVETRSGNVHVIDMPPEPKFKVGDKARVLPGATGFAADVVGQIVEIINGTGPNVKYRAPEGWTSFTARKNLEPVKPEPAPLQIEEGKFYRTRDGRKVGPIKIDRERLWPAYAEAADGEQYLSEWRLDGTWHCDMFRADERDLVAEWIEEPAPEADGWIEWQGGQRPVPSDTRVDVRFRDGDATAGHAASCWDWSYRGHDCDIVAYRVVES